MTETTTQQPKAEPVLAAFVPMIPPSVAALYGVVSQEAGRFALHGVSLIFKTDGTLEAVATDGRRLVKATFPAIDGMAPPEKALALILDEDGVVAFLKAAGKVKTKVPTIPTHRTVKVSVEGRDATLASISGATIKAHLIDGTFPKYDDVIPKADEESAKKFDVLLSGMLLSSTAQAMLGVAGHGRGDGLGGVRFRMGAKKHAAVRMDYKLHGVDVVGALMPMDAT